MALDAVVNGVLGALGQSGDVCRDALAVQVWLETGHGYPALVDQITTAVLPRVRRGDIVVVAQKVLAALGCADHNETAHDIAQAITADGGPIVDVVVSTTDTGIAARRPLIGALTLGATPLGATKGVSLYEAMRCACAAEFVRGSDRGIPIVLCRPAKHCADRVGMGEQRGYAGTLDRDREGTPSHD